MGDTFVTPKCRASYPHLFKAYKFPNSDNEAEYSITMLFPKATTNLKAMHAFICAARDAKWPDKVDHARIDPPNFFRDGDTSEKPEYAGMWYIKAKSTRKPTVIDQKVDEIEDVEQHKIYPGCWVKVAISTYAWTFAGKIGVKLNLDHVQLVGDDETFVSRSDPKELFAPIPVEADDAMANSGFDPGPTEAPSATDDGAPWAP